MRLIKSIVLGGGRFQRLFPARVSATASDRRRHDEWNLPLLKKKKNVLCDELLSITNLSPRGTLLQFGF